MGSWSEEHPRVWLNIEIVKRKVVTYSQVGPVNWRWW